MQLLKLCVSVVEEKNVGTWQWMSHLQHALICSTAKAQRLRDIKCSAVLHPKTLLLAFGRSQSPRNATQVSS